MGTRARAVALGLALLAPVGCGDPFVVIGDAPGTLRITAGIPDSAGAVIGATATRTALHGPRGLAVDGSGLLYVADHENARIVSVRPDGRIDVLIDHSGRQNEPRLRAPDGLALDAMGGLVIADPVAHRIWRLDPASGELAALAGTGQRGSSPDTVLDPLSADLETPAGVAVDPEGRVYFSEMFGHRVRRIEAENRLVTFAGTAIGGFGGDRGPAARARLLRPAGLAIGGGTLYIADSGNQRVRAVDLGTGTIRTVAGSGTAGFGGDGGPAVEATLRTPAALAVSVDGRSLFIADRDNHRIRRVHLGSGEITTFAGTGEQAFNGDLLAAGSTALSAPGGLAFGGGAFLFISDTGHHVVRRTAVQFFTGR